MFPVFCTFYQSKLLKYLHDCSMDPKKQKPARLCTLSKVVQLTNEEYL